MTKILFTGLTGFLGGNFLSFVKDEKDLSVSPLACDVLAAQGKLTDFSYRFTKEDLVAEGLGDMDVLVHAGAFSPKNADGMNDIPNNIQNITNTAHLFNSLPRAPRKIIYVSTISVYDLPRLKVIDENSPAAADSIYGLSKLMSERIALEYAKAHHAECQILRLGVMYGNNKAYAGLIPTLIQNVLQGKPVLLYNGGKERKNFVHVREACRVILKAIREPVVHPVVNVVAPTSLPIRDIAEKIIQISGKSNIEMQSVEKDIPSFDVIFNTRKLVEAFGAPVMDYDSGLADAYRFFEKELT